MHFLFLFESQRFIIEPFEKNESMLYILDMLSKRDNNPYKIQYI